MGVGGGGEAEGMGCKGGDGAEYGQGGQSDRRGASWALEKLEKMARPLDWEGSALRSKKNRVSLTA